MKKIDILLLGLILLVVILLGAMLFNFSSKEGKCSMNPQKYYMTELEKANNADSGSVYCTCTGTNSMGVGIIITSNSTGYFNHNQRAPGSLSSMDINFSNIKIGNSSG